MIMKGLEEEILYFNLSLILVDTSSRFESPTSLDFEMKLGFTIPSSCG